MKMFMPVALPPGRARLDTRPSFTGSSPTPNTIGICGGRGFGRTCSKRATGRGDYGYAAADKVGHQRRQPLVLTAEPVVLHRNVLAFDVAGFAQALAEGGHP